MMVVAAMVVAVVVVAAMVVVVVVMVFVFGDRVGAGGSIGGGGEALAEGGWVTVVEWQWRRAAGCYGGGSCTAPQAEITNEHAKTY